MTLFKGESQQQPPALRSSDRLTARHFKRVFDTFILLDLFQLFLLHKIALYLLYKGRFRCIIELNMINIIHNINTINIKGKEKHYAGDNDSRFLRNSRQPATQ